MRPVSFVPCLAIVAAGVAQSQGFAPDNLEPRPSTRMQLVAEVLPVSAQPAGKIFVKLTLKNVSSKYVSLSDGSEPRADYSITVRNASGMEPPKTQFGELIGAGIGGSRRAQYDLGPGKDHPITIEITALYQLTEPGTYSVRVARHIGTVLDEDNKKYREVAYSDPVQFTIAP